MHTVEFELYVIAIKNESLYVDVHNNLSAFRDQAKIFYSQRSANYFINNHIEIRDKMYLNHKDNMEVRKWSIQENRG